jgi:choline dehydrogenase-like flavoprotein
MMGTTRMSDDPRDGVVDRDCRVHGVENLYIAGSATFTTGGYANPTLTNLALSIRVADRVKEALNHLKKNLQYLFVLFLLKSPLFVLMFSHKIR